MIRAASLMASMIAIRSFGGDVVGRADGWGSAPSPTISPEVAYSGSGFHWAPSPGSYAPKFNQRKARKLAQRRRML